MKITDGENKSHKFYEAVVYSTPNILNGWKCPENIANNLDSPPYAGRSFPDGVCLTKFSFKNKCHWENKQDECIEWIDEWMLHQGLDIQEIHFNPSRDLWLRCLTDHMIDEYFVSRSKWKYFKKTGNLV